MHICLDIDDTITYQPSFFMKLSHSFSDAKITIVTFRTDREAAEVYLNQIGIRYDKLIVSSDAKLGQKEGETLHVWKANLINEMQPDLFFEDMPEAVALVDDSIAVFQPCDHVIRGWIRDQISKS